MYFSRPFNDSVGRSFGYHGPFDRNLSDGKNPSTEKKKIGKKKETGTGVTPFVVPSSVQHRRRKSNAKYSH